jgi:hypothetical protein
LELEVAVHFLDSEHELGATVYLSGKSVGSGPMTIRLERCGTAKARLVDSAGKPVKGQSVNISLIVTPGLNFGDRDRDPARLVANAADPFRFDPKHYRVYPVSDADGRITFPDLIPGATYRFIDGGRMNSPTRKEITVKPGETLDLGDMLIEHPTKVN